MTGGFNGRLVPAFTLFGFSAKFDPVASMLVQDHRSVIPDFYGVTTSFMRRTLKPGDTILAEETGAPWVKYIHGDYGKGSWTYLGGHDPEDPQHPPVDGAFGPGAEDTSPVADEHGAVGLPDRL